MQAAAGDATLFSMTINMHTHFVPAQMVDALRQPTEPPWIEAMPNGSERIHLPIVAAVVELGCATGTPMPVSEGVLALVRQMARGRWLY